MPFSPGPVNATAVHSGECCDGQRAAKPPALLMHGAVAQRAHDLYVKSGYRQGQSDENWLQAEADLRDRGTAACNTEHRILGVFAPDAGGDV
jgi:hypothetical protein